MIFVLAAVVALVVLWAVVRRGAPARTADAAPAVAAPHVPGKQIRRFHSRGGM